MTRIDSLIYALISAASEMGALSERHGRTKRLRRHLMARRTEADNDAKAKRQALQAEINETYRRARVQHKAALTTYGRHLESCAGHDDGKDCTCGLDMLLEEDVFAWPLVEPPVDGA